MDTRNKGNAKRCICGVVNQCQKTTDLGNFSKGIDKTSKICYNTGNNMMRLNFNNLSKQVFFISYASCDCLLGQRRLLIIPKGVYI